MTVENWLGNPRGMVQAAATVPQTLLRQQVKDFPRLISTVNAATAKSRPRRPARRGLSREASDDEPRRSHRRVTKRFHTDGAEPYRLQHWDEGARALAYGLKGNATLDTLYLGNNSIGDEGAQALAESLK